jgi:hypothetical protein
VQGHPEYPGYNYFTHWFLKKIEDYVIMNTDLDWVGDGRNARRRMDPDVLKFRKLVMDESILQSVVKED